MLFSCRNRLGNRPWTGRLLSLLSISALLLFTALGALAQSNTDGAIGGTVVDVSGAVLPNASVNAKNLGTNQEFNAVADSVGHFRVGRLQPGTYSLTIKAAGFADVTLPTVIVEVGLVTEQDIKMSVNGKTESVNVSAAAPLVNTEQQDFTTNVNQTSIDNLPINGRRWSSFALLTPGANPDGGFGLISFRGISGLLNNNTVDGGDNNQAFFSEEKGRTRLSYEISEASVQEFQVNTSDYSAEYGRSAGGVVNAVTKSGTNSLHGSGFYYIRDNAVGATNPSTLLTSLQNGVAVTAPFKPEDRRQQFGGTIGGPIIKDKLFYFFSYDQQKRNFPGDATPNNPQNFFAPASAAELATFSTRTGLTGAAATTAFNNGLAFLDSLTGPVPRTGDQTLFFPKIDWHASNSQEVSISYNRLRWNSPAGVQTGPTSARGIASFGNDGVHADDVNAKLTSLISNTITNELRFKYGRDFEFEFSQKPAPGEPTSSINGSVPDVNPGPDFEFGKPTFLNRPAFPDEHRYQWADAATIVHGNHVFKFGLDINHVNDLSQNLFEESGSFTYNTRLDFISDMTNPNGCTYGSGATAVQGPCWSSFAQGFGPLGLDFTTNDYNFFGQDAWRVLPRLSINLGLRYEYEQLPSAVLPTTSIPQTFTLPNFKRDFGPRFGFAWDVFGDGKTAVRGGYGLYYGRIINSTIFNALIDTGNAGGQFQSSIFLNSKSSAATVNAAPRYPNVLSSGTAPKPSVQFFDFGFRPPRIQQADLVIEREVLPNTVVSASYLMSMGDFLPNFIDTNLPAATGTTTYLVQGGALNGQTFTAPLYTGARPNANFNQMTSITSNISSRYDALVLQANRRLHQGLQFQSSYTYSRAFDAGQTSTTFTTNNNVLDPANPGGEYGPSSFDYRHRFVLSAVYEPTFQLDNGMLRRIVNGFTLSPIYQLSSGHPFTGTVSGNVPGGTSGDLLGTGVSTGSRAFFQQRNSFYFPRTQDVDLRLSREIKLHESVSLELMAEAFNLFNHRNVTGINATEFLLSRNPLNGAGSPGAGTAANPLVLNLNSGFGQPFTNGFNNSSIFRERELQFAARVNF